MEDNGKDVRGVWKLAALVVLITVAAYAFMVTMGQAAQITKINEKSVVITGEMGPNFAKKVEAYIYKNPSTNVFFLNSPGGTVAAGIQLGSIFNRIGATTVVAAGDACISSCAFAFLGGANQKLEGALMFHRAWGNAKDGYTHNDYLSDGQQIGGYIMWYMISVGYSTQFFYFIATETDLNKFMVFKDVKELNKLYVGGPDTPVIKFTERLPITQSWVDERIK